MYKRKVVFAILFILGVSLLNVAVLIDASNQVDQLAVDAFEQQPITASEIASVVANKKCNIKNGECDIDDTRNCAIYKATGNCIPPPISRTP